MGFGVDTVTPLNDINWADLHTWKGSYPEFAGRYFGGGYTWEGSEFTAAKSSTGGVLTHIVPLRAAADDSEARYQTSGSTGYTYGTEDGNDSCTRIYNAIDAGQLVLPSTPTINVYLDIEPDTTLTPAYWAGFATAVYDFDHDGVLPFVACLYAHYVLNSSGLYVPDGSVTGALNAAYSEYPDSDVICYGFWASEPQPCDYCPAPTVPSWTVFGGYAQPYAGGTYTAPVYLHQYATTIGCIDTCGYGSGWAGGQNLDMDGSDSTNAEDFMLLIA
jgi:hypothetical protein